MRRSARRRAAAPLKVVLTPQEKVAVTIAAQTAATEQDSQAPLFANLGTAASSAALPPKLQQAVYAGAGAADQPRSKSDRR